MPRGSRTRRLGVRRVRAALRRKPRELTPDERDRYGIGTEEERKAYCAEWERKYPGIKWEAVPPEGTTPAKNESPAEGK